jgi:hypothetical protein
MSIGRPIDADSGGGGGGAWAATKTVEKKRTLSVATLRSGSRVLDM